ncbi:FAD-dependent oxidoreductase [Rhizobium sp. RU36D]|uniref:NAD(P)/FAD-dependent oxidoreductase n=1 Tax=Rhizobium sp. RU36D TaxID=1907415 RepID=UPI0009D81C15|nr:FAD-dependent oxidoreductase [Rhizobium sp. RU36D]SMC40336.1 Glycine/D-amino acid oxidase [Rhizobium sp. RU36D]
MSDRTGLLNKKRQLRTDRPLWAASPHISVEASATPAHRDYDVIIIGSGISGALMAQALADGKRRILVVDRREPVRGSTMASTAMIQHEIDVPLHQLGKMIGEKNAAAVWRRSARSVRDLGRLVEDLGIDCMFEKRNTLLLAGDEYGARALAEEADTRKAAGLEVDYLKPAELRQRFELDRTAALLSDCSASANPAQLTAGLLIAARTRGVEIVSGVTITDYRETRDGVVLATSDGRLLSAGDVIACTGYEFLTEMQHPSHQIVSTWAIATKPNAPRPAWLKDFLVWEASDPYLYFRSTPDGRIIAGGEDEADPKAHLDKDKAKLKFERIIKKLEVLLGVEIGKPAYGWAAPFGTTATGLPIIDKVPGCDHVHCVMGFGGNGITFSKIAAELLAARLAGKSDPDANRFLYPA